MRPTLSDTFESRHIRPLGEDLQKMLQVVGASSLDALVDSIVRSDIRLKQAIPLAAGDAEAACHQRLRTIASHNKLFRTYIGLGYHDTHPPAVVARNVFE